ncbi:MAG: tryptophan-rich sensory protein [Firmicutes bacterium]|nr:tryptophan-rich sensory protein [Bacillota bacterium]
MSKRKDILGLLFSLLLVGVAAAVASFFASGSTDIYQSLNRPPLAPPAWVFPLAWSVLYFLMAVSAWLVWRQGGEGVSRALALYVGQLLVNVFWPRLFFADQAFGAALVWLLLLLVLVIAMIKAFYPISRWAAFLQIPYLVWLLFAGYLNFMAVVLNSP